MKKPLLDFLKVDEELNERLRSWWALIEGFLKALNELLIRTEKLAWETLSFECSWKLSWMLFKSLFFSS